MSYPDIPHLALPFRFENGRAAVTEQNSGQEIEDCVVAVLSYPLGYREELPGFGLEDQTFKELGADIPEIQDVIRQWEDRADALIDDDTSALDQMVERVQINLETTDD